MSQNHDWELFVYKRTSSTFHMANYRRKSCWQLQNILNNFSKIWNVVLQIPVIYFILVNDDEYTWRLYWLERVKHVANFGFIEPKDKPVTFITFWRIQLNVQKYWILKYSVYMVSEIPVNEEYFNRKVLPCKIKLNPSCNMGDQYFRGCEVKSVLCAIYHLWNDFPTI